MYLFDKDSLHKDMLEEFRYQILGIEYQLDKIELKKDFVFDHIQERTHIHMV